MKTKTTTAGKTAKIIGVFALACGLLFTGCKKEPGPKGDKGDTGAQGPSGTPTIQNISITVQPINWTYSSLYQQWYYNYPCTSNSQSAVLGYIMSGNGKQVLPYVDTPGNCRYTMATDLFKTSPYIQFQFTNFTTATVAPVSSPKTSTI